ncbi:MAG: squalene-hopene/tetraprenyl-beta-curcumene cyclase [Bryobacterales bacterium]|jgi:squalene-hopene/tetraprenyl-beta-curcumene cyclase|nr:squalene-hopene/tetraprenyl-beta-curcumene cyclase [Bryobacterales bacterium]
MTSPLPTLNSGRSSGRALQVSDELLSAAQQATRRASEYLLSLQHDDGYWCALLTADTTLESDYILLQLWLHPPVDGVWNPPNRGQINRAMDRILSQQLPDGGFNIYVQGPSEISASVKAYFALKIGGLAFDDPRLTKLRTRIIELGGIQAANSYTKVNLSLFDLYPREGTPSIPPEILLLPGKLLYQMSSWTRAIIVALAIVHAHDPKRPVPAGFTLEELFIPGKSTIFESEDSWLSWRKTFIQSDKILKLWEKYGFARIRRAALRKCEHWMLERMRHAHGLGAIYPPMQYSIMALEVLGYRKDHPLLVEAIRQFDSLMVDDGQKLFFQPCFSPVWDTAIGTYALAEAGVPGSSQALTRAADWLLKREIRRNGDWSVKRPTTEPSGWAFEFENDWYPDIDDTAMVMLAFPQIQASSTKAQKTTARRAIDWLLAMQSKDGGWAAFDVDNNWEILTHVPFADHNAMLDPTCADITGRTLEALAANGFDRNHPACRRALDYLTRTQLADGSWYGRWGVAFIYGTCFALRGLRAMGEDDHEPHIQRANEWLRSIQNPDGGWGESCASYDNDVFTAATSTPSQTAWALMGLMAGGDTYSSSVRHGIEYLIGTQQEDGAWLEALATGTGFPKVFYLNYHYYRLYFPLLAVATFLKQHGA